MSLESYGISDIGLVRQNNEDVWAELPQCNFYALADGMGGHQAGEIAAKEAIETLCRCVTLFFNSPQQVHSPKDLILFLKGAFSEANAHVFHLSQKKDELKGMGTTLCSFLIYEKCLIYAHVGDSRLYRYSNKKLTQLTQDHSLRQEMMARLQYDKDQYRSLPNKNILTRAIGTSPHVEIDCDLCPIFQDDIYFLCSDGLTDQLTEEDLRQVLEKSNSIKEACHLLVEAAKDGGSSDNITILMVRVS